MRVKQTERKFHDEKMKREHELAQEGKQKKGNELEKNKVKQIGKLRMATGPTKPLT